MSGELVDRFASLWMTLDIDTIDEIDALYAQTIRFVDPFVNLDGIEALKRYLRHSYGGTASVAFEMGARLVGDGEAMLCWTLRFRHPRLRGGAEIAVPGSTHLRFGSHITHHTDYYDAGALIYEQLPLLGAVVRTVKQRFQV
jgi:hypothetical protein